MARKDVLRGLMAPATGNPPAPPRSTRGAIGAVNQSIAELRTRSLIEVPCDMIDDAGLPERMEAEAGIEALAESIRTYGQQVPVMLRHSPNTEGRYEVVYGRRRVAALKHLGQPVRALVRELTDRELIVAQGQENSARRDLSFIEKARFAKAMAGMGFERPVICDALSIDKTVLSRMLSVIDALPEEVVEAIGPAPGAGRDRWLALAERARGRPARDLVAAALGPDSDARFAAVFAALATPRAQAEPLRAGDAQIGRIRRGKTRTALEVAPDFGDWLAANIDRLHRDWKSGRD
ncbi:plasmid partitioning protein RepB [Rhodobaculum claviforme]|uniref:Plasmid partitioning protein RepB n=1 Tax=Rhodobaculum claviforme TaxID=1549854 RepID=A0A934WE09_9RHOB|nr:plasmid partitioning protein RepB [Rhodobaculum claviforme]MBK5925905.1 plasmid partitioning protein RepB [Rhodobaculum claviforme]